MAVGGEERRRGERLVNLPADLMLTPMARVVIAKYRKPQDDKNVLGKIWNGDPYDAKTSDGPLWPNPQNAIAHERQHTYQGEQLGPLYLPSNLLGGLTAMVKDGEWHGDSNWNEAGPQQDTPQVWGRRK